MKNAQVIICLFVLFVLGTVSGIGISNTARHPFAARQPWSEQEWLDRRFEEDCRRLKLTPEQREAFRAQYEILAADMRQLREETARKVREIFLRRGADIIRPLTPEQREEYRKLNAGRTARGKAANP